MRLVHGQRALIIVSKLAISVSALRLRDRLAPHDYTKANMNTHGPLFPSKGTLSLIPELTSTETLMVGYARFGKELTKTHQNMTPPATARFLRGDTAADNRRGGVRLNTSCASERQARLYINWM